jgi:hypothetical protein
MLMLAVGGTSVNCGLEHTHAVSLCSLCTRVGLSSSQYGCLVLSTSFPTAKGGSVQHLYDPVRELLNIASVLLYQSRQPQSSAQVQGEGTDLVPWDGGSVKVI